MHLIILPSPRSQSDFPRGHFMTMHFLLSHDLNLIERSTLAILGRRIDYSSSFANYVLFLSSKSYEPALQIPVVFLFCLINISNSLRFASSITHCFILLIFKPVTVEGGCQFCNFGSKAIIYIKLIISFPLP